MTPGTEVFDNVASELSCPLDIKGNQHVDRLYYLFNSQDQLDAAWNKYHPSLAANNELCPSPDGSFYPHDWYYRPGKTIGHDVCYVLSDGSPALEATYNFWKLYVIFIGVPGLNKSDVADVWSNTDGVYAPSQ